MRRSEYEAKLKSLNKEIEELKKLEIEEDGFWKPKYDAEYWSINSDGDVNKINWFNDPIDDKRLYFGNIFKTKEEAKLEAERLKVYRRLRFFSTKYKVDRERFSICYDCVSNKIKYVSRKNTNTKYSGLIFATEKDARDAVEFVGYDNVLRYYLDI